MKKTIFTGAGVAIATPMFADGSINYNELGRLIEFNIENGTDAIIICGTPSRRPQAAYLLSRAPAPTTPNTR